MDLQQKIDHYKEKFKTDPLFRRIANESFDEELFSNVEFFSKLTFTDTYNSKQVAHILNIKEHTLVNYLNRDDFKPYLKVYKQDRFYRYDWLSIFKFKMIFLLAKYDFSPMEIASIIGTRPEAAIDTPEEFIQPNNPLKVKQEIEVLTSDLVDERMSAIINSLKMREDFKDQRTILDSVISSLEIQLKFENERLWALNGRLDDLEGYTKFMKATSVYVQEIPTGGLFSKLFKKSSSTEKSENTMQNELSGLDAKKEKLQEAISQIEEKVEEINTKLESAKKELNQFVSDNHPSNNLTSKSNNGLIAESEGINHEVSISTKIIDHN